MKQQVIVCQISEAYNYLSVPECPFLLLSPFYVWQKYKWTLQRVQHSHLSMPNLFVFANFAKCAVYQAKRKMTWSYTEFYVDTQSEKVFFFLESREDQRC